MTRKKHSGEADYKKHDLDGFFVASGSSMYLVEWWDFHRTNRRS